jgi:hypothetical protein
VAADEISFTQHRTYGIGKCQRKYPDLAQRTLRRYGCSQHWTSDSGRQGGKFLTPFQRNRYVKVTARLDWDPRGARKRREVCAKT